MEVTRETIFINGKGEKMTLQEVVIRIKEYLKDCDDYTIAVGTDSQNFHKTKVVNAVVAHRSGKGGIFFYNVYWVKKIKDLRSKIYHETAESLKLAETLTELFLEEDLPYEISIHCDIGEQGKTRELIREISGYVESMGYGQCLIKPEGFACSIADRISK